MAPKVGERAVPPSPTLRLSSGTRNQTRHSDTTRDGFPESERVSRTYWTLRRLKGKLPKKLAPQVGTKRTRQLSMTRKTLKKLARPG